MKVKLPRFTCLRCGHEWIPKNEEKPLRCAFCKSPYWEKAPAAVVPQTSRHDEVCLGCRQKRRA